MCILKIDHECVSLCVCEFHTPCEGAWIQGWVRRGVPTVYATSVVPVHLRLTDSYH